VAQGLLELIYLFTNIFFYGKRSFTITSPLHNRLGAWVFLIPVLGGLAVGVMIHFWEPTLKGRGRQTCGPPSGGHKLLKAQCPTRDFAGTRSARASRNDG